MTTKAGFDPAPDDSNSNSTAPPQPRRKRRARNPFPGTSRAAYAKAGRGRSAIYVAILDLFDAHGPMVDDDLHERYLAAGYSPRSRQCIATARCELTDLKLVRKAGRGLSHMGNPAYLWEKRETGGGVWDGAE